MTRKRKRQKNNEGNVSRALSSIRRTCFRPAILPTTVVEWFGERVSTNHVRRIVVLENDPALKHYLEDLCSPSHIWNGCFGIKPRDGLINIIIWRTRLQNNIKLLLPWNKGLRNMCSPSHVRNLCFGIRPRALFFQTIIWRTCSPNHVRNGCFAHQYNFSFFIWMDILPCDVAAALE